MKNKLLLCFFLLTSITIFAQVGNSYKAEIKQINKAVEQAIKAKTISNFDSLIALRNTEKSSFCGYWQSGKAYALTKIHEKELRHYDKNDQEKSAKVKEILEAYEKALNECASCVVSNKYQRFKFL